jgi:type I restriction enzyme M protein
VPEGIIFQSQTAYKDLRKMLVENSLVAVISLPAGVFNPYSGVKTSILILDKSLAKKTDKIAFFKVENDGFGLGAQRRAVEGDDLPFVLEEITNYELRITNGEELITSEDDRVLIVPKSKIAANGDYNLSGERYRDETPKNLIFPLVKIGDICSTSSGGTPLSGNTAYYEGGKIPWLRSGEVSQGEVFHSELFITEEGLKNSSAKIFPINTVLVAMYGATAGEVGILRFESATNQAVCGIMPNDQLDPKFLYLCLKANKPSLIRLAGGGAQPNISQKIIRDFEIPLPPIAIQKEIVTEIEGYQKVINGARAVIDNYRPHIAISPDWEIIKLGDIIESKPKNGYSGSPVDYPTDLKVLTLTATTSGKMDLSKFKFLDENIPIDSPCRCRRGDIYLQRGNTKELVGTAAIFDVDDENFIYPDLMIRVRADETKITSLYLLNILQSSPVRQYVTRNAVGAAGSMPKINQTIVDNIPIPVPPIEIQKAIVAEIQAEQALVNANRELIERFEKKIQTVLNRIWGN